MFFYPLVIVPIVLVGNKLDLSRVKYNIKPVVKDVLVIERLKCIAMARRIGAYTYMECSAMGNYGVRDVFDMAFRAIIPGLKKKVPIKYQILSKVNM